MKNDITLQEMDAFKAYRQCIQETEKRGGGMATEDYAKFKHIENLLWIAIAEAMKGDSK